MQKADFLKCVEEIVAKIELVHHAKILRTHSYRLLMHLTRNRILMRYFLCIRKMYWDTLQIFAREM